MHMPDSLPAKQIRELWFAIMDAYRRWIQRLIMPPARSLRYSAGHDVSWS